MVIIQRCHALTLPAAVRAISGGGDNDRRRDVDWAHLEAFRNASAALQDIYFDSIYGIDQLRLQILGTLPRYQRRGLGTALCKWGMKRARRDGVVITLISSPMGYKLYEHIGFQDRGKEIVRAQGEKEKLSVHVMDFDLRPTTPQPRLELV
jgi:GNAT superfamily N-acetyltransferase